MVLKLTFSNLIFNNLIFKMENNLWNDTHTEYSQDKCIHFLFEEQVERTPNAVALVFKQQQLTYQELNQKANQLAHYLQQLGVKPEQLVGLCVERSLETVIGILGILKAGGAYVPLDPNYPSERIAYSLCDSQVQILLTKQKYVPELPKHEAKVVCLDRDWQEIANHNSENLRTDVRSDNLAYVIYTSGSTGKPKGVLVEHYNVVRLFAATQDWYNFNHNDVWTLFHSYAFDFSVWELWGALIYGGKLVVVPYLVSRSPDTFYQLLEKEGVTVLNQTPSAFLQLIQVEESANIIPKLNLRYVIFGGEALEFQSLRPWFERHGDRTPQLVNMYGITETTVHVTYRPLKQEDLAKSSSVIGCPIPDLKLYLLNSDLQPVPIGVVGEMYVGGAGVARGYLNREELTRERFIDNPFNNKPQSRLYKTGDLAKYLPNGELEYLGRIDNQVKIRGFRIELGEIESVLNSHQQIQQVVTIAREDVPGDKRLVAYVVTRSEQLQSSELRSFVAERLPNYMVPSAFVFLDTMPLTPNGKVDRRALPAPSFEGSEAEYIPSRTPTEEKVARIWTEVLNLERVGVNDNFFELGGHSLLATQIISRLRSEFQIELQIQNLLEATTVRELSESIDSDHFTTTTAPRKPITARQQTIAPLSFNQEGLWFLNRLEGQNATYNIPLVLRLTGKLDCSCLEKAIAASIERHEALRTRFIEVDGVPQQEILPASQIELGSIDLSQLSQSERDSKVMQLAQQEAQQSFDLTQAPLIRAQLIYLEAGTHVLLLTVHHIVSDGWSMNILVDELWTYYRALVTKSPVQLAPLPIQYGDFSWWRREQLSDKVIAPHIEYWQHQLAGISPTIELPLDRSRPAQQTFAGNSRSFRLNAELTAKLYSLSQQSGTTLYMSMLATFAVLLHRYSRQEDIVIGSPVANRNQPEVESLIGFFVNTLALHIDFANQPTFSSLLQQVRQVTLEAYAHQDLPFSKLIEKLQLDRDLSHHPLFQVMFTWQNTPDYHEELENLSVQPWEIPSVAAKFDLAVSISESAGELRGSLTYKTDLFDEATIDRLLNHWQILIQAIADAPKTPVNRLPLLTTAEQQQLLIEWNQTQTDTDLEQCIHQLFAEQVELTPDAVAVCGAEQQLTYRELNNRANQLAHYLQHLGVKPDELVAICLPRTADALVSILGVLKAGAAYLFIDPKFPTSSIDFRLQDAQTRILVTNQAIASQHSALPIEHQICLNLEKQNLATLNTTNPTNVTTATNLVYAIYTSGSTGKPKGVAVEHRQLVNYVRGIITRLDLTRAKNFATVSTFAADLGNTVVFPALCTGGCLHIIAEECLNNANTFAAYCRQHPIDCLKIVPSHLEALLAVAETHDFLPQSHLILGGEASNWQLIKKIKQINSKCTIFNHYGPTETTVGVLTYQTPSNNKDIDRAIVPLGKPLPNTQVYVLNADLQPVPVGVPGELHIGGAGLARGYLNRSDLTAAKFITGSFAANLNTRLYKTGDLVRYRSDGNLEFLGRIDNQVKIRGFRIELGEIEAVLAQHPSIRETAVLIREDRPGDKRLVAYIVATEQVQSSDLRSFVAERLLNYMVPSAFVFLDTIPLTPNGKVDRRSLPAPDTSNIQLDGEFVPPSNPTEELLATIWADVLGAKRIGINDNFFELGGHSLLATQVISRCCQTFSVEIALQSLFESPTIAALARTITQYQNQADDLSQYQPILPREKGDGTPLSFAQQRLWFLDRLEPNSSFYNMPHAVRLKGELKIELLQQALNAIVAQHEVIRTNYKSENGSSIQVIAASQSVELPIIDLQQYDSTQQQSQVQKLLQQESQKPFDLASDLMLRSCLLQLAPSEHILLVVMHHIASDGWSMGILWSQLTQIYQAFNDGKPNPLQTLPIQYADYAVWQREWLSGEVLDKQLNYWVQQLAGANPLLELPTDRPRPPIQTYCGASQSFTLPQSLSDQLRKLCRNEGVTLYMTLLAAFQILLYRYSRQEDIIVGSPVAGRNRAEIEELIGFFVNTIVLRSDLSGNPNFLELLQRVRSTVLDAYTHQDLPFDKLVDELRPERSLSYNPLFQVMFDLQNQTTKVREASDLKIAPLPVEQVTAKFDLTLSIEDTPEGLMGWWEYNSDLFDAATIERMNGHFQTLLEGIVANPQQPIAQLPLLTATEREQLLVEWNDTHTEYPQDKCIHSLFEEQVERTPDAVAVVFKEQQLTYRQLNNRANQLAHYLQKLGVGSEVLVGICVDRSLEMMVGLLGILKAGGAYVPLDPAYPVERLAYMISDAEISVLLTQNKWISKLPEHQAKVICLDLHWKKIALHSQENPTLTNTGENLAYSIYTSGSTGNPKGVMISHEALISFTQTAVSEYKITPRDRVLQFASINFDAAVEEIYPSLYTGATLILRTDEMLGDLQTFFQACEDLQLTVLDLPTAYWHQLTAELGNTNVALPKSLRLVIIGGERVLPEPVRIWQEYVVKSGKSNYLQLINTYGPTETTVSATLYRIPVSRSSTVKEVPIGRPLVHLQTYILDSHLQPVPIGIPGELHIGGDSLAKGYLNRPKLTAEKFIPNPFSQEKGLRLYKTGDLTRYLSDGNIEFLGRIDNQVKIRGFRIEPGEIESVLTQHPNIREIVIIAREDVPGDKRLVAYVVPELKQPQSSELRSFVQERLPNYMVPSAFVFLDTMPLTPNGKVDRRALPAPDNTRQEPSSIVIPQDQLESQLIQIWEQVLNIQPIGIEDNFFDLGGNSLQAVTLFAQIEKQFGKKLPLATLFQSSTVAEIAQIIRQQKWLAPWESLVAIQPNGHKPPLFYMHGGGGNLLVYRDLAHSLGLDQPVYGLQPKGLDGKYVPFNRIEDMAAHYLAQIRRLQPNDPYFLAGLSIGGATAWEIAQLLQTQGQKVALLALFDTNGPDYYKILPPLPRLLSVFKWVILNSLRKLSGLPRKLVLKSKQLGAKQILIKILENLGIVKKVLNEDQKINQDKMQRIFKVKLAQYKSVSNNISSLEKWINSLAIFLLKRFAPGSYAEVFVEALSGNQTNTINDVSEIPEALQKVQEANVLANQNYIPSVYSGKVILFRASDRPPGFYDDPKLGWGDLAAGGMEIYEIQGNHTSIMQSPILAEKLKDCLDKAQAD